MAGVAAVAVASAELFKLVVQFSHGVLAFGVATDEIGQRAASHRTEHPRRALASENQRQCLPGNHSVKLSAFHLNHVAPVQGESSGITGQNSNSVVALRIGIAGHDAQAVMSVLVSMAGFPGKSGWALAVAHRLPVNESPQLHNPAACSLGEPASKVALSAAPLQSNQLRHFLKVTICSTWGQLSKVGAGVRWPVRRQAPERAIGSVLALPAKRTRHLFSMEGVGPFKSMGKASNFNPTMCCPGEHTADLSL